METSSYAVIGSIITSCLVIIVPIIKSAFDNYSEKKNRVFDNELKVKREIYEEFLISAGELSTLKIDERHKFIAVAMKTCLYCDINVRYGIQFLINQIEHSALVNSDPELNDAIQKDKKIGVYQDVINNIACDLKKELDLIILDYSNNYTNKLKRRIMKRISDTKNLRKKRKKQKK